MKLDDIREDIDRIDDSMKELFVQRMKYSDMVAGVKAESGDRIYKPERESAMTERLLCDTDADILSEYELFVRAVIRISRKYQYRKIIERKKADLDVACEDKIRLMLQTDDIAGMLTVISDYNMKVLNINSSCSEKNSYYIDIAASGDKKDVKALIYQLECEADKCIIM